LRADGSRSDDLGAMAGPQGRHFRSAHRRTDGARNPARPAAPGRIRVLAPCRARTRGDSCGRETRTARGGGVTSEKLVRLESDAVRHRACIGIFEIAVARERPQGEKFRIAMVTKIEHAGETGGGVARLVPEAILALRA